MSIGDGQFAKVDFESLFAFAVAGVSSGIGHDGVLGKAQVLGHLGLQCTLDQALGQLPPQGCCCKGLFLLS